MTEHHPRPAIDDMLEVIVLLSINNSADVNKAFTVPTRFDTRNRLIANPTPGSPTSSIFDPGAANKPNATSSDVCVRVRN